jgi:hypothetical protein
MYVSKDLTGSGEPAEEIGVVIKFDLRIEQAKKRNSSAVQSQRRRKYQTKIGYWQQHC